MDIRQNAENELSNFVIGKRITSVVYNDRKAMADYGIRDDGAFDLTFDDGSSLELYVIGGRLCWVISDDCKQAGAAG